MHQRGLRAGAGADAAHAHRPEGCRRVPRGLVGRSARADRGADARGHRSQGPRRRRRVHVQLVGRAWWSGQPHRGLLRRGRRHRGGAHDLRAHDGRVVGQRVRRRWRRPTRPTWCTASSSSSGAPTRRSATRTSRRSCSRPSMPAPRSWSSTHGAPRWPARADLHLADPPGHRCRAGPRDRPPVAAARPRSTTRSSPTHADGADEFLADGRRVAARASRGGHRPGAERHPRRWPIGGAAPGRRCCASAGARNATPTAARRAAPILALPVLGGHFGVPGSGVIGSTSAARQPRRGGAGRRPRSTAPSGGTCPLHQVGRWMAPGSDDPCEVLFVQGANPLVMCPDTDAVVAAFERDDVFTVVHEQVLTDTTRYADVVLPATTSFEIDDVAVELRHLRRAARAPGDRPVGESRSNDEVGPRARATRWAWTGSPRRSPMPCDDAGPAHRRRAAPAVRRHVAPPTVRARLVDPAQGVPRYVPVPHDRDASRSRSSRRRRRS